MHRYTVEKAHYKLQSRGVHDSVLTKCIEKAGTPLTESHIPPLALWVIFKPTFQWYELNVAISLVIQEASGSNLKDNRKKKAQFTGANCNRTHCNIQLSFCCQSIACHTTSWNNSVSLSLSSCSLYWVFGFCQPDLKWHVSSVIVKLETSNIILWENILLAFSKSYW